MNEKTMRQLLEVKKLTENNNYALAKKIALELFESWPNDRNLIRALAKICEYEKDYVKAEELLERLEDKYVYKSLIPVYLKLGELDKLYDIFLEHYAYKKFNKTSLNNRIKMFLSKLFDMPFRPYDNLTYSQSLVWDYNENRVIEYIKNNYCSSRASTSQEPTFSEGIDIQRLFHQVKEYIEDNKDKASIDSAVTEGYCFYYPGCGRDKNCASLDYLGVFTFINTSEIITMYPLKRIREFGEVCQLEESQPQNLIRAKTGLERFKSRYGNNFKG